jgi:acyl carrier protein
MTGTQSPITLQQLSEYLDERFAIGIRGAPPDALLEEDLGLDSLQRYEILLIIEELGVLLDEDDVALCKTVGDLYRLYLTARQVPGER